MARNSNNREPPQTDYSSAPKNLRNFQQGRNILPQGIITGERQTIHNVEHIIKYLNSPAFEDRISNIIGSLDPSGLEGRIETLERWISNYTPPTIPDMQIHSLGMTVNGSGDAVTGTPYNPAQAPATFNIDISGYIQENPLYPLKPGYFEANTPNGITEYELPADINVVLVKKMLSNANGIKFTSGFTKDTERIIFLHMAASSPNTNNVSVGFANAPPPNVNLQQAAIVLISGGYAMYQQIGAGGSMGLA